MQKAKIKVIIPSSLQRLTRGKKEVISCGATVRGLIDDLERQFPGIKNNLCQRDGRLLSFINFYVNEEDIRFIHQEDTLLQEGDEVLILLAIAGG